VIFGTNTHHTHDTLESLEVGQKVRLSFNFEANLGPGSYSISVALHAEDNHIGRNYEWKDRALIFTVINIGEDKFIGVSWIPPVINKSVI
jgi:lipopolysaccharide transport system ATP-binding protein